MNSKTKNIKTKSSIEHRASSRVHKPSISLFRTLCFLFVSFCFLTSFVTARARSEQLSSADFLLPYLNQILQDVNMPIVQIQDAGFSSSDLLTPYLEKTLSYVNTPTVQTKEVKTGPIPQEEPQASDTVAVFPAADGNQILPQMDSTVPAYISTRYGRQLWQAGTSAYQDREDNKSKIELKQLIEQIRSIEFKPKKPAPEPVITVEPMETKVEPNETPSVVGVIEETEKKTTESKSPYEPVTNQTLQMLTGIAQDPNQVEKPFELGEVLYVSGHLREAAVFYREALNRIDTDKAGAAKNRPWILFQLGNCLREHDLPAAKKIYVQLITEHPESTWVDLAKTRGKIIDWFLKDKPQTFINERQS